MAQLLAARFFTNDIKQCVVLTNYSAICSPLFFVCFHDKIDAELIHGTHANTLNLSLRGMCMQYGFNAYTHIFFTEICITLRRSFEQQPKLTNGTAGQVTQSKTIN